MVAQGPKNVLYINNNPVTRAEKDQYVPTSIVPNIAASLTDDAGNETSMVGSQYWPYKPILLVANKQPAEPY